MVCRRSRASRRHVVRMRWAYQYVNAKKVKGHHMWHSESATVTEDGLEGTRRGYILNILIHQNNTIS